MIKALIQHLNDSGYNIKNVELLSNGLESSVYTANVNGENTVIKVPIDVITSNANDSFVDYKDVFEKECLINKHFSNLPSCESIPVPKPIASGVFDGLPYIVQSFVKGDGSLADEKVVVETLSKIHSVKSPIVFKDNIKNSSYKKVISQRIIERLENVRSFGISILGGFNEYDIESQLTHDNNEPCLLHMDFRQANIITEEGKILSVFDWSNSLFASPLLELGRVTAYGEYSENLITTYLLANPSVEYCETAFRIYCLDTLVMLSLVFLSEEPNEDLAKITLAKLQDCASKINY